MDFVVRLLDGGQTPRASSAPIGSCVSASEMQADNSSQRGQTLLYKYVRAETVRQGNDQAQDYDGLNSRRALLRNGSLGG